MPKNTCLISGISKEILFIKNNISFILFPLVKAKALDSLHNDLLFNSYFLKIQLSTDKRDPKYLLVK